ncbi:hypothetical protein CW368_05110 [Actinomycetales bacterium SN12]|nr:hypothetical protein CW368_05110 [Actinomycetales bacterium SN12]
MSSAAVQVGRWRRLALAPVGLIVVAVALSGCMPKPTAEEQFIEAREANRVFKDAVADVQVRVFDDAWEVAEDYGQSPSGCGNTSNRDTYYFHMARWTPEGWRMPEDIQAMVTDLGRWLDENGWTGIKLRTYSEGISNIVLEARNRDRNVELLVLDMNPGELYDAASIRVDSTCLPGDWLAIGEVQGLDGDNFDRFPATEYPRDVPAFGFDENGRLKYDD